MPSTESFDDPRPRDGAADPEAQLPPYPYPSYPMEYTPGSPSNDTITADKGGPADQDDEESAPLLLTDPPPRYEDAWRKHDGGGGSSPVAAGPGSPGGCKRGSGGCRRRGKRCRKMCLLVLLKIVLLGGAVVCLFGAIRGWRARHYHYTYTCTTEYEDDSNYNYNHSPPQRNTTLNTGPDPIRGRWPLYDTLSLTTTSGNIAVTIDPQPADPDDADRDRPARVVLRSTSGSIAVSFSVPDAAASLGDEEMRRGLGDLAGGDLDHDHDQDDTTKTKTRTKTKKKKHTCKPNPNPNPTPRNQKQKRTYASPPPLPPRPYEISIRTETGSITGHILFSTSAVLESGTGAISAVLTPVFYPPAASNVTLRTRSATGDQDVRVMAPLGVSSSLSPFGSPSGEQKQTTKQKQSDNSRYTVHSSHTSSGSGNLRIAYARGWAGEVHASAPGDGQIRLHGGELEGMQVQEKEEKDGVTFTEPGYDYDARDGISPLANVSLVAEGPGAIDFFVVE
ncbi:hypothetical protein VTN02DRAFT_5517 [Thermoascus thermophilus]